MGVTYAMHQDTTALRPSLLDPCDGPRNERSKWVISVVPHIREVQSAVSSALTHTPSRSREVDEHLDPPRPRFRSEGIGPDLAEIRVTLRLAIDEAFADADDVRDADRMQHRRVSRMFPTSPSAAA